MRKTTIRGVFLVLCTLLSLAPVLAQKVIEKQLPYHDGQEVVMKLPIGKTILISGWDKKEVAITARVDINNNKLNEAYSLKVEEGKVLRIEARLDNDMLKSSSSDDCDNNYQTIRNGTRTAICAEIFYEIKVPRTASLKLETISADIEAKGLEGPTQLKAISGFIDFSWPPAKDAELQLKSVTGELYTNLAFEILNKQEKTPIVGYELKGRNGKGGPLLELETISSNIYLRGSE